MTYAAWLLAGLAAGGLGAIAPGQSLAQRLLSFLAGLVGALAGGWLFRDFGAAGAIGVNVWSASLALICGIGLLLFLRGARQANF